jgi:hypothetical protein
MIGTTFPNGTPPPYRRLVGGINKVWLIGMVSIAPEPVNDPLGGGEVTLVSAVRQGQAEAVERFRVRSLAGNLPPVGTEVLVEGSLVTIDGRQRAVLAREVTELNAAPDSPDRESSPAGAAHAAPVAHDRRGHWRTLGRGTARERLVWVRSTFVGGAAASDG